MKIKKCKSQIKKIKLCKSQIFKHFLALAYNVYDYGIF